MKQDKSCKKKRKEIKRIGKRKKKKEKYKGE
jgi:hypothetical protein